MNEPPAIRPLVRVEFLLGEPGQRHDRAFGEVAIALGDGDRVAVAGDQLDAEREAPLADHQPHPVERVS